MQIPNPTESVARLGAQGAPSSAEQHWHRRGRGARVVRRRIAQGAAGLVALAIPGCALVPDAIVEPEGDTVTTEDGGSVTVSVRLEREPRGVITVQAVSSDPSEATVSGPLTFDRTNWDEPQTITVTGVDDAEQDGDVAYKVRFEALGAPPHDTPRLREVLAFVNRDAGDAAVFAGIGDLPGGEQESRLRDVSADGRVFAGTSVGEQGEEALRFTRAEGLTGLGAAPSSATAVSPDGSVIAGGASGGPGETGPGALWYGDRPVEYLVGDQGGGAPVLPPMFELGTPRVVLNDGTVYGDCTQAGSGTYGSGCRQDGPGVITILAGVSRLYDADQLGNYGGQILPTRYGAPLRPATLNGGGLPYPQDAYCITPGSCDAALRAFSQGAAIAVGTSLIYPPRPDPYGAPGELEETAWIYTAATGVTERLPDLPGGVQASGAYAISADGSIVGGFGTDAMGQRAVLWIDREVFTIEELISEQGGSVPEGWELSEVNALSDDGRTIAGNGVNPDGVPEGFIVVLPRRP